MSTKRQEKREALRTKLVNAAEKRIAMDGMASVKARDLARDAGCALGAIYTAFDDMDALFMEVNGRTFRALGKAVAASQQDTDACDPAECLIRMSHAYLDFAVANTMAWQALFDINMSTDMDVPTWYLEELSCLFAHIRMPLQKRWPERDGEALELMTRGLFSSVHGIVLLGLQNRISGVPRDQIAQMIEVILCEVTK